MSQLTKTHMMKDLAHVIRYGQEYLYVETGRYKAYNHASIRALVRAGMVTAKEVAKGVFYVYPTEEFMASNVGEEFTITCKCGEVTVFKTASNGWSFRVGTNVYAGFDSIPAAVAAIDNAIPAEDPTMATNPKDATTMKSRITTENIGAVREAANEAGKEVAAAKADAPTPAIKTNTTIFTEGFIQPEVCKIVVGRGDVTGVVDVEPLFVQVVGRAQKPAKDA